MSRLITLIAVATIAVATQAEDCGHLGVLNFDPSSLPDGVDPAAVRQCKEHPLGRNATKIDKRNCWYGAPYGCSLGFCYKTCGTPDSGEWCFTAWNQGWGVWRTCSANQDCAPDPTADCGQGDDCIECGCSCH